ncbi:hypothetical protein [Burkholderia gladioli]|uniref:hypothetical protein n=1 Tax=Burkholderia gladioli TaxID=28095 RepID=UPI00164228FF|nr:hypothetical protein [Burkholderia gladioli]
MIDTNSEIQKISERLATLEQTVSDHRMMLEAVKDSALSTLTQATAISVALSLALEELGPVARARIEQTISLMTRDFPDREHAAKLQAIFEENLRLKLSL